MAMIRFGICQWAIPLSGPAGCQKAVEIGLDGVELDLGEYEDGFPLSDRNNRSQFERLRRETGIQYPSLAVNALCRHGMKHAAQTIEGRIARRAIEEGIQSAAALAIPIVQLPSFDDGWIENEKDFRRTAESIQFAADLASRSGIVIGVENVLAPDECRKLLGLVDRPNVKVFFDLQNYSLFRGFDTANLIRELGDLICEIHAKDGAGGVISSALLGDGEAGFQKSVQALKEIGFAGWVHLENYYGKPPLSAKGEDPFALLAKDLHTLKSVLG